MSAPPVSDAPFMLSVSGARGIVGATMTPMVAATYAAAFGSFVKARSDSASPLLCVGRDSRPSGDMLARAAIAGLQSTGCRVIDVGIVATPTVGVMIGQHRADAGLVLTASHNPIEWNGIKCLNHMGVAPPAHDAAEIVERFRAERIDAVGPTEIGAVERDRDADTVHVARVLARVDRDPIAARGFRVALDSVNGGGCRSGRMLLEELGCELVHINGEPTGRFAHTPEPIAENLGDLCRTVVSSSAVVGFAQDPDADRLAIVDETGRYIGEEYTLVLAAKRLLDLAARAGTTAPCVLAANLSTSRMIDALAAQYDGATVVRTAVGEANVAEAMLAATNGLIGGEGNGGVIWPAVGWVRDSLGAMALVLGLLADDARPLSAIVDELPRYAMVKEKMDLAAVGGREAIDSILATARTALPEAEVNDADGVRLDVETGWVHLRPSNTEPIVRLIAEAADDATVADLIATVRRHCGLAG